VAAALETKKIKKSRLQSRIHVEARYPHPRSKVWRALTEPALMEKWGMRPEGFAPTVGTKFKLIDDGPHKGWRGYVECEVVAVEHERMLQTTWVGDDSGNRLILTYTLRDDGAGTHLTLEHEGFEGVGGFVLSKLIMGPGWKKMMRKSLAGVLADL